MDLKYVVLKAIFGENVDPKDIKIERGTNGSPIVLKTKIEETHYTVLIRPTSSEMNIGIQIGELLIPFPFKPFQRE
jgi:hypothetical protein